jgi:hypothetical protein
MNEHSVGKKKTAKHMIVSLIKAFRVLCKGTALTGTKTHTQYSYVTILLTG